MRCSTSKASQVAGGSTVALPETASAPELVRCGPSAVAGLGATRVGNCQPLVPATADELLLLKAAPSASSPLQVVCPRLLSPFSLGAALPLTAASSSALSARELR